MSADPASKRCLLRSSTELLDRFAHLLRRVSFRDIGLSTLICQTLHNLLYNSADSAAEGAFASSAELRDLSCSLQDSLTELVACAEDMVEDGSNGSEGGSSADDEQYARFVQVGRVVLRLLFELGI